MARSERRPADVLIRCNDFLKTYRVHPNPDKAFVKRTWKNLTALPVRKANSQGRELRGVISILRHTELASHVMTLMECPMFYEGLTVPELETFLTKMDPTVRSPSVLLCRIAH